MAAPTAQTLTKRDSALFYSDYSATLSMLRNVAVPGMRFCLQPMRELDARLGHPWKSFLPVLIAGTNGKGSTAAFLSEILHRAGYKVGLYTSPHLSSYRERIRISQSLIDERSWCAAFSTLMDAVQGLENGATEFELLSALSFLAFRNAGVEVAVLEVGLGGRLDATNVVEPALSLIAAIDYDHCQILGKTLPEIAFEKAGILREKRPAIALKQDPVVMQTLQREADLKSANLSFVEPECQLSSISLKRQVFGYQGKRYSPALLGLHQAANASLAIEGAKALIGLGLSIEEKHLEAGVNEARWPGRMEVVRENPAIFLDGAHNPQGCRTLVQTLSRLPLSKPDSLILGVLEDKDVEGMIEALSPWGERWILTEPLNRRAMKVEALYDLVKSKIPTKPVFAARNLAAACREGLNQLQGRGTLCIAGSLTTVGEARRLLGGKHVYR